MTKRIIRSIRFLANYFKEHYVDPNDEQDKNLDIYEYAIDAFETIVEDLDRDFSKLPDNVRSIYEEDKNMFLILIEQDNYEDFEKILSHFDDLLAEEFEKR